MINNKQVKEQYLRIKKTIFLSVKYKQKHNHRIKQQKDISQKKLYSQDLNYVQKI